MTPPAAGDALLTPRSTASPVPPAPGRTLGTPAFLAVAVVSFGGPLALAAVYAPAAVDDTTGSAGLVSVLAATAFAAPLLVWLRYARHIADAGGLYSFVRAAAGPRVAMAQAVLWIASYALYLVYTTASIVYETLPAVLPAERSWQPVLEIAIPVALAAVMVAGRAATMVVLCVLAAGQLALVAILAGVSIANGGAAAPISSFGVHAAAGDVGLATGNIALLYVCGSLPLFLGGEVRRPTRTIRSGLVGGFALTAVGVTATVFPLAANPAFVHAPIPGMSMAQVFAGHSLAVAIGIGVAASVAGVMLVEFVAVSRLLSALTARPIAPIVRAMAAALVLSAPLTLIAPERIYADLVEPSLVALWLSQLLVFAVYPRFAARAGQSRVVSAPLAIIGVAFTVFGIYAATQNAGT
jgi:amino acid transporter